MDINPYSDLPTVYYQLVGNVVTSYQIPVLRLLAITLGIPFPRQQSNPFVVLI